MHLRPSIYVPRVSRSRDAFNAVVEWLDQFDVRTLRIGALLFCAVVWAVVGLLCLTAYEASGGF